MRGCAHARTRPLGDPGARFGILHPVPGYRSRVVCRRRQQNPSCTPVSRDAEHSVQVDDIVTVTLARPLGLNLKEDGRRVVIESIERNSNADRAGVFAEGDTLVACSAIMMVTDSAAAKTKSGSGTIYDRDSRGKKGGCCSTGCLDCPFNHRNWQRIMFDCRGKNFETVIAALQSNFQARWLARGGANKDVRITISITRA